MIFNVWFHVNLTDDDESSDDEDSHPIVTKKPSVEPVPEPKVTQFLQYFYLLS